MKLKILLTILVIILSTGCAGYAPTPHPLSYAPSTESLDNYLENVYHSPNSVPSSTIPRTRTIRATTYSGGRATTTTIRVY